MNVETAQLTESAVGTEALGSVLIGLLAVLALIFLLAWLARKFKLLQSQTPGLQIKLLASMPLSTREKVSLIEIGDQQFLIGVAPGSVNKLHHFEQSIQPTEANSDNSTKSHLFADQLKSALGLQTTNANKSSDNASQNLRGEQ
jgi:flagellar protein FliO/FliZ